MPDVSARRVLDAWTDRLAPAEEAAALARWDAACRATPENRERSAEAARELERLEHDTTGFAKILESLDEGVADALLRRSLEVLRRRLLGHQVPRPERLVTLEVELAAAFARHRAEVGGRRLAAQDVAETLRASGDPRRLEGVWRAAVGVGREVAPLVREAVALRNEHARSLGYDDYRALRLEVTDVEPRFLERFLAELEEGTNALWATEKREIDERLSRRHAVSDTRLEAWQHGDVFLQHLPAQLLRGGDPFAGKDPIALARRTFQELALDVDGVLARSDLHAREGKNPHAFCTHVDRRGDVRILANVANDGCWTRTMLHELGHAVYDLGLGTSLPWALARPPHAAVTEGVALLFEGLFHHPVWRREVAGLHEDEHAAARARSELLVFLRWALVVSRFEEGLYRDPGQDLDGLWWSLVERLQGVARPDPSPPGVWAAEVHVACHPVHYHAHLLGQAVASLLGRWIREDLPGGRLVGRPAAAAALALRVFAPGATRSWMDLVREATGHELTAAALLEGLGDVVATS